MQIGLTLDRFIRLVILCNKLYSSLIIDLMKLLALRAMLILSPFLFLEFPMQDRSETFWAILNLNYARKSPFIPWSRLELVQFIAVPKLKFCKTFLNGAIIYELLVITTRWEIKICCKCSIFFYIAICNSTIWFNLFAYIFWISQKDLHQLYRV